MQVPTGSLASEARKQGFVCTAHYLIETQLRPDVLDAGNRIRHRNRGSQHKPAHCSALNHAQQLIAGVCLGAQQRKQHRCVKGRLGGGKMPRDHAEASMHPAAAATPVQLLEAVQANDTDRLQQMFAVRSAAHSKLLNRTLPGGLTALQHATRNGRTQIMALLIEKRADQTVEDPVTKRIPLHEAAYNHGADAVKVLLRACRDSSERSKLCDIKCSDGGFTALHFAAEVLDLQSVHALLAKGNADPSIEDFDGDTALHVSANEAGWRVCQLLMRHGGRASHENSKKKRARLLTRKFPFQCCDFKEGLSGEATDGVPKTFCQVRELLERAYNQEMEPGSCNCFQGIEFLLHDKLPAQLQQHLTQQVQLCGGQLVDQPTGRELLVSQLFDCGSSNASVSPMWVQYCAAARRVLPIKVRHTVSSLWLLSGLWRMLI